MIKYKIIRVRFTILLPALVALVVIQGNCLSPGAASGPSSSQSPDFGDGGKADDAVRRAILAGPEIPRTIFDVHGRLKGLGGKLQTYIVANRGHENPRLGSFSFFETYTGPMKDGRVEEGELFIGFFSGTDGDALTVDQGFRAGSLMVELIAWDRTKQVYNFWELIGNGTGSDWLYRGDSDDILADVAQINVGSRNPSFGRRLRCSGCHTLGGPIMKELGSPHNDWWTTERKLNLGRFKLKSGPDADSPTSVAARLFQEATDASDLSRQVRGGIDRLVAARAKKGGGGPGLRQRLRSLFTTMEMNLAADSVPFRAREEAGSSVEVPQAFFVDARLVGEERKEGPIPVELPLYKDALEEVGFAFARGETDGLVEAFHAFVVPVRSYIDNRVIDSLIQEKMLDVELVADVLAVDFTTPVYSRARASLIRFVPDAATNAGELKAQLIAALEKAPQDPAAKQLLENLTDPARDADFHREAALAYLDVVSKARTSRRAVVDWLAVASQRRVEIADAETSRNPRGKILEPGFRVIFPTDKFDSKAGRLQIEPGTARVIPGS